ncbi:hypothetical protein ES707_17383 [subsurface metagenome]
MAEELFELAGVEPDAGAIGAVVDFDLGELKGNHCVFTGRAIHSTPNQKAKIKMQNYTAKFKMSDYRVSGVFVSAATRAMLMVVSYIWIVARSRGGFRRVGGEIMFLTVDFWVCSV